MHHEIFYQSYDFDGSTEDLFFLFSKKSYAFLLDSNLGKSPRGRFSFIGFEPFDIFCSNDKKSLEKLEIKYKEHQSVFQNKPPVPFNGGLVGFLGYDLGMSLESIPSSILAQKTLPDCFFGFYDGVIAIDHFFKKLYVIAAGLPVKDISLSKRYAKAKIADIVKILGGYRRRNQRSLDSDFCQSSLDDAHLFQSNFTKTEYLQSVQKALQYIERGDIYQVNLSQRFLVQNITGYPMDPFHVYRALSRFSPSHFSAFLNAGEFCIISHSPEEFLRLEGRHVWTYPMKGTRARGKDFIEDQFLKNDLLTSAKEKAELLMVTDLERNDFGRVCEYGSIQVASMRTLEEYATVFQTIAVVQGLLKKGKDFFDIIRCCFPSGSVTGCPKIRAMEIIDEVESVRRGPYTGSLGYLSFDGQADFNVLIRTVVQHQEQISFHVGGGIVADSVPENEYEETLIKSKALCAAVSHVFAETARMS